MLPEMSLQGRGRIRHHGTEFPQPEVPPSLADAGMREEDRAARLQPDGQGDQRADGNGRQQQQAGNGNIKESLQPLAALVEQPVAALRGRAGEQGNRLRDFGR